MKKIESTPKEIIKLLESGEIVKASRSEPDYKLGNGYISEDEKVFFCSLNWEYRAAPNWTYFLPNDRFFWVEYAEPKKETKPLTIEEVIEFKPSMENPMVVECFDGYYSGSCKKVKIIAVYKGGYAFITEEDTLLTFSAGVLYHYASLKQPKEKIALYRTIGNVGDLEVCDSNGLFPSFIDKKFEGGSRGNERIRKANRQKEPCAFLDPDTFEVEWV